MKRAILTDRRNDVVIIGENKFSTIIALTQDEHERGLMFKPWPPPVMSFPYNTAAVRKFWMKNTPSALDIIFCRGGFVIDIKHGKPYDCTLICPNSETDLVVELPHGTVEAHNISVGDPVRVKYSLDTLVKQIGRR
jgi:uncharacterized membrane protein (UPF0127 family)